MQDPYFLVVVLAGLSLAPFVVVMVTSYVKLVVVFSLIRNALGIQQIPPNMVINGLAVILSIYIMAPVGYEVYGVLQKLPAEKVTFQHLKEIVPEASEPLREFLSKHSKERERQFFLKSARKMWPKEKSEKLEERDLLVLIPSFAVGELTSAFQIGFLLYLPFIVIDLVISNILMAMGMMMVSPMTISLPFKLLLFVLLDGWTKLIHGLVLSYA
ncbi:MAG: type III secretion system export apparatus subunit SctR [Thermodesulforhabdaceae bacterium]